MTVELIEKINSQVQSWKEGISIKPTVIPVNSEEYVIFIRWEREKIDVESLFDSHATWYISTDDEPRDWKTLDLVLENIFPNISYFQYKKLLKSLEKRENLWDVTGYDEEWNSYDEDEDEEEREDSTEYGYRYIVLSELEEFVENETLQNK